MSTYILRPLAITLLSAVLAIGCAVAPEVYDKTLPVADQARAAIADAKAANKAAQALGAEWRDTDKIIKQAEQALTDGDELLSVVDTPVGEAEAKYKEALALANKAKAQAEMAQNQYYLEQAKFKLEKLNAMSGLNSQQQAMLADANAAYRESKGREAYELASKLEASLAAASIAYQVMSGDSLWAIAGKSSIYADPYQWPLILKANSHKIKDADLIYPGQEFAINRSPSAAEVDAAVTHAKTRGAWSIGVVEESDKAFLAQ